MASHPACERMGHHGRKEVFPGRRPLRRVCEHWRGTGLQPDLCGGCQAAQRPREDPGAGDKGAHEPGTSRTAGLGLPWAAARPQASSQGRGLWAGKGSVGLQRPWVEGQEWEGGLCWALGTPGGPCLADEQASSCLAQASPSLPGLPTPAPSQGNPSHPAPPGTLGGNRVQELGLDKGFLQELSLRSPHLELSHTAGGRRRARPQAGREMQLRVAQGPLALGSRDAEAWRWVQAPGNL